MIAAGQKIALWAGDQLGTVFAKGTDGPLRYSPHDIVCVLGEGTHVGRDARDVTGIPRAQPVPVVNNIDAVIAAGANVLVIGIAPPGGKLPAAWQGILDEAIAKGLSIVNGLHTPYAARYNNLRPSQWIWDVRQEPPGLAPGKGLAQTLTNKRVLMIGTDMGVGKKTTGLEIYQAGLRAGYNVGFVATGQGGITIMGDGVPLDAIRVDFAAGAIEQAVMKHADKDIVVIEGQGALSHPSSVSNLALLRGAQPTHLVLCHAHDRKNLFSVPDYPTPPVEQWRDYCAIYEMLSGMGGQFPRAQTVGIALNTHGLSDDDAHTQTALIERITGLPCVDPVRDGGERLFDAVATAHNTPTAQPKPFRLL